MSARVDTQLIFSELKLEFPFPFSVGRTEPDAGISLQKIFGL